MSLSSKLKPAARVSGQKQDVWYVIAPGPFVDEKFGETMRRED